MTTKPSLTSIGQLVPELPVTDVERAQRHYRDALGFEIGWLHPDGIGAVSRGNVAIFFRKTKPPFPVRFTGSSPKISMRPTTS
jgi:catechol 2,3-dioxygenase-like lactoylglutathione lyase family enzyme